MLALSVANVIAFATGCLCGGVLLCGLVVYCAVVLGKRYDASKD